MEKGFTKASSNTWIVNEEFLVCFSLHTGRLREAQTQEVLTLLMFTEHFMAEGFRQPTQKKASFHIGSFLLFGSVLVNMSNLLAYE